MVDDKIAIKFLNVAFINKNFINDSNKIKDKYNYEKYLFDFINNSVLIKENNNQKFSYVYNQSNGECDIENINYDIDFKLFIPQDTVEALNNHSSQIVKLFDGVIAHCDSKKHNSYIVYNYLGLLKNVSMDELIIIKDKKFGFTKEESIIKKIIKLVEINKNMLFFIPIEIIIDKNLTCNKQLEKVLTNFSRYLKGLMTYRNAYINKDTYFSFIFNNKFILTKYIGNTLHLIDEINVEVSELFMEIKDMTSIWE